MSAVRRRGRESTPAGELPSPNGVDDPQAKGPHRDRPPFPPRTLDDAAALFLRYEEWLTPLLLTLASFVLHFRNIAIWDKVCWDEAHFGKFGANYIRRQYFFDLHPPLGKMMIAFSGWVAGYDGSWNWESEATYPANIPWVAMRLFCAASGALTAPLAYYTAKGMGMTKGGTIAATIMIMTELGYLTLSRFILLDPLLLFFTAVSVFLLVKFRQIQEEKGAFNLEWWIWLSLLGISLGSVLSVKWLGLFTVATVGVYTIYDLWRLLLNPATTLHKALPAHFLARVLCLIIFPIATYVFWFWVHFKVLNKEDYQIRDLPTIFHGRFDKQHAGQRFDGMPYDVAYESSQVTIRAARWNGPHLFSNADHKYPEGSKQQVVSSSNFQRSQWTFELMWPRYHAKKAASPEEKSKLEFVRNGDYVRVNHVDTGRNMHSHQIKANLTQRDYEVTGFYQRDFGDSNDHFIIEIIDDLRNPLTYIFPWLLPDDHIHPLYTRFRLRHNETGCYLNSGYKHLPAWGGNNIEITCARFLGKHAESVAWYVDRHVNPRLPATPPGFYKPTLLADVWAAQKGMWASNEALTDDPNKDPEPFQSQPWQWPILYRGLRIVNWADDKIKYFMFGNPIVWWGGFASLFGIVIFYVLGFVAQSRGWASVPDAVEQERFWFAGVHVCLLGWALHYFPFFLMRRVLYLHHYHPALYFAIFAFALSFDTAVRRYMPKRFQRSAHVVFIFVILAFFWFFKDFSLGLQGPARAYANRKWFSTWDMYDEVPESSDTVEESTDDSEAHAEM